MIRFKTESGSLYELHKNRWKSTSVSTRSSWGYVTWHSEVVVGKPVSITGPSLTEGGLFRLIHTTPVTEILENTPDEDVQVRTLGGLPPS